jgi:hypothetical protein
VGSKISPFPYILASKDDQTIFSVQSVPKNFRLSDPDHLKTPKIEQLYTHWLRRQDKGLKPFVVLNASPNLGGNAKKSQKSEKAKGKGKMRYVDVGSDDGSVQEENEDNMESDKEEEDDEDETKDKDQDEDNSQEDDEEDKDKEDGDNTEEEEDQEGDRILKNQPIIQRQQGVRDPGPSKSHRPKPLQTKKSIKYLKPSEVEEKKDGKKRKRGNQNNDSELEDVEKTMERPAPPNHLKKTDFKKKNPQRELPTGPPQKLAKMDAGKKAGRIGGERPLDDPLVVS